MIIFVHGVLGDARTTWLNGNSYWPEMLTQDKTFDGQDIFVYSYPTPLLNRSFSIDELAENLRLVLIAQGVLRYKQITIVSHSMGGLVTRAFLIKYQNQFAKKIRFLYFFATPTTGSPYAALISLVSKNSQFGQMYPMSNVDSYLNPLQSNWLAAHLGLKSYCAYETQPLKGQIIVERESATNLCTEHLDPIDANHVDLVKPVDASSTAYQALKGAFEETRNLPYIRSAPKNSSVPARNVAAAPTNSANPFSLGSGSATSTGQQGGIPAGTVNLVIQDQASLTRSHIAELMANISTADDGNSLDDLLLLKDSLPNDQQKRIDAAISKEEYSLNDRSHQGEREMRCPDPSSSAVKAALKSEDVEDRRGQLLACNAWLDATSQGDSSHTPRNAKYTRVAEYVQTLVELAIHDSSLRIRFIAIERVNQIFASTDGYPNWTSTILESRAIEEWYRAHSANFELVTLLANTRSNGGTYGDTVDVYDQIQDLKSDSSPSLEKRADATLSKLRDEASARTQSIFEQSPDNSKPHYEQSQCASIVADMKAQLADPETITRVHFEGVGIVAGTSFVHSFLPELAYLKSCSESEALIPELGEYSASAASLAGRYEAVETLNALTHSDLDPFDTRAIQNWWKAHKAGKVSPRHEAVKAPEEPASPVVVFSPTNPPGAVTKPFHIHVTKREPHDPREGFLAMNVYYENDGDEEEDYLAGGTSFLLADSVPDLTSKEGREAEIKREDMLIKAVSDSLELNPAMNLHLESHGSAWNTMPQGQTNKLDQGMIDNLLQRKSMAYGVSVWRYKSGNVTKQTESCSMWNADVRVNISCLKHNGDHIVTK